jgi:hypothetical protein
MPEKVSATRFRFDHRPGTWYEASIGPSTVYGPVADEEALHAVEVKFVIDAKIQDGRRSPPEGSVAKVVMICDERLVPCRAEMRQLLTLLVGSLPGSSAIDWNRLIPGRVQLRFGPPPAPRDRNPVLEFRPPPGSDKDHQEGDPEPEQVDPPFPSPHEGEGPEAQDMPRPARPARDVSQSEPGVLLRGWKHICKTLGLRLDQKRALKRMNETQGGPIEKFGRGRPPEVFKNELLAWWSNLEQRAEASQQTQKARRLTFNDPLPYGRQGEGVFPALSMHVKKRRSDRQPGSSQNNQV